MNSNPAPHYAPGEIVGALLVGGIVSTAFYGVLFMQTCIYFRRYPEDSIYLKGIVAAVGILQTINVALISHALWHYLVVNYGNFPSIEKLVWSVMFPTLTNATSATLIHLFFIRQVFILSGRKWFLASFIFLLSITQCALGWALALLGLIPRIAQESAAVRAIVPSSFAITAGTDIFITASLVYYLQFRKTKNERTDSVVNKLIMMSVNNGLLSSTIAFGAFICVVVWDAGFVTIALCSLLGKAYGNSLLGSLNSRQARREELSEQLRGELRRHSQAYCPESLLASTNPPTQSRTNTQESDTVELTGMDPVHVQRPSSPGVFVTKEVVKSWEEQGMPYDGTVPVYGRIEPVRYQRPPAVSLHERLQPASGWAA
ncbi:hypothetical protein K523DRAFT_353145 [Schizophyllum commune Tattone D]|nr:hypothetical protein K523DRAFT_353145 [Schizophyllum commune Tattone D]